MELAPLNVGHWESETSVACYCQWLKACSFSATISSDITYGEECTSKHAYHSGIVLSTSTLEARSSKINVLANVRPEVVHLAKLYALLAQDVVDGGHVEEKVGHQPAVDVASGGDVDALAGTEADGDGGLVAAVDGGLVGAVDDGGDLVDAGVELGEGLEVVLVGLGGGAGEAGDGLLCGLVRM